MKKLESKVWLPSLLIVLGIFALYQTGDEISPEQKEFAQMSKVLQSMDSFDFDGYVTVKEREDELTVYIDLIGDINKENVYIGIEQNAILVSGVKQVIFEERKGRETNISRKISSYSDVIEIPEGINISNIQIIKNDDGVTIVLPKLVK